MSEREREREYHCLFGKLKYCACILDLQEALKETPDKKFYVAYDLYAKNNPHYHNKILYPYEAYDTFDMNRLRTPQLNNITLMLN